MTPEASAASSAQQPTEGIEPLSPAARKRVQTCYEHAQKLIAPGEYDYDYVHTLLGQCVGSDPGNLVYVDAMFDNLQRKYKNNKKGGKGAVNKAPFKKAVSKKEWREVLRLAPEVLHPNPWDVPSLRSIAEACQHLHLNEVELRYLKTALDAAPKDADVNRHCAQSLTRMGQFDMAIACWHRVEEANKGDLEAKKAISALTVEKSRAQMGFDEEEEQEKPGVAGKTPARPAATRPAPPARPSAAPPEKKAEPPRHRAEIELTPRQKLEQAIVSDPAIIEPYLELAQLHSEEGRLRDALHVLEKARDAAGSGDLRVSEALEDAQIAAARQQLAVAEQRAASLQNDESQELVRRLRADLNRLELQVFASRANRYPDDKRLRLELGHRLKRAGNYDEALKELAIAAGHPQLAAPAYLLEGECRQQLKQYPEALKAYEQALAAGGPAEVREMTLYRAGILAAALHHHEAAEKWLEALVGLNPDFRDARARLDKIRAMGDKG